MDFSSANKSTVNQFCVELISVRTAVLLWDLMGVFLLKARSDWLLRIVLDSNCNILLKKPKLVNSCCRCWSCWILQGDFVDIDRTFLVCKLLSNFMFIGTLKQAHYAYFYSHISFGVILLSKLLDPVRYCAEKNCKTNYKTNSTESSRNHSNDLKILSLPSHYIFNCDMLVFSNPVMYYNRLISTLILP